MTDTPLHSPLFTPLEEDFGPLSASASGDTPQEAPTGDPIPVQSPTLLSEPVEDRLESTAGPDSLVGGTGADILAGGLGDDILDGGRGSDLLRGSFGADVLTGGQGHDTLWGGEGGDLLVGGSGNDTLWTGRGDDTANGGSGDDLLDGGGGHDRMFGGIGNDTLWGGIGQDTLNGQWGNDSLMGGVGHDFVNGGAGDDIVMGGSGRDTLVVGLGEDTLTGGDHADVFRILPNATSMSTITDFTPGLESIDASRVNDLTLVDSLNGAILYGAGGVAVLLQNVSYADIDISRDIVGVLRPGLGQEFLIGDSGSDTSFTMSEGDTLTFSLNVTLFDANALTLLSVSSDLGSVSSGLSLDLPVAGAALRYDITFDGETDFDALTDGQDGTATLDLTFLYGTGQTYVQQVTVTVQGDSALPLAPPPLGAEVLAAEDPLLPLMNAEQFDFATQPAGGGTQEALPEATGPTQSPPSGDPGLADPVEDIPLLDAGDSLLV